MRTHLTLAEARLPCSPLPSVHRHGPLEYPEAVGLIATVAIIPLFTASLGLEKISPHRRLHNSKCQQKKIGFEEQTVCWAACPIQGRDITGSHQAPGLQDKEQFGELPPLAKQLMRWWVAVLVAQESA